MSSLKSHEKKIFELLFDRSGYVLDFTDGTYAEFFREHGIDIQARKYQINGTSKMKRLRAFWEMETDLIVGKVLSALLDYAGAIEKIPENDKNSASQIIGRLIGKPTTKVSKESTETDFLNQEFTKPDFSKLELDTTFQQVINQRIGEIQKSLNVKQKCIIFVLFVIKNKCCDGCKFL